MKKPLLEEWVAKGLEKQIQQSKDGISIPKGEKKWIRNENKITSLIRPDFWSPSRHIVELCNDFWVVLQLRDDTMAVP